MSLIEWLLLFILVSMLGLFIYCFLVDTLKLHKCIPCRIKDAKIKELETRFNRWE